MTRITPAHAGKSCRSTLMAGWAQDHPRTRGEKPEDALHQRGVIGSPPHTRGKVELAQILKIGQADHPRTRGEKDAVTSASRIAPGSPPHTRGKAAERQQRFIQTGITPAHAGKRS